MLHFMEYKDNFYELHNNSKRKLLLYGIGESAEYIYPYLPEVSYACDKRADGNIFFHGLKVINQKDLLSIKSNLSILICVKSALVRQEIKDELQELCLPDTDIYVFEYYHNCAFNCFKTKKRVQYKRDIQYVRIVCIDTGWILNKFATRMQDELEKLGIHAEIGKGIDPNADINHHISYHTYEPIRNERDTLMITHVDSQNKVDLLKHQLKTASMGICMSKDTMNQLTAYGIPRDKLCYVNPAQDGVIRPKKYVLGVTHKNHASIDKRKRIEALVDICRNISPDYFQFKIMGSGWEKVVLSIRKLGFDVEYFSEFEYEEYIRLMPSLDYYLFWGFDEGSMGYLDALAAGIGTIVTPQGYHLDIQDGITHPCRTIYDFVQILQKLQNERRQRVMSVSNLTWDNYVRKHIEIWKYLLGNEEEVYINKHFYEDGIFSVLGLNS